MLITLADATPAGCGGKAAGLAKLVQAGLPVPPGFVVPASIYRQVVAPLLASGGEAELERRLTAVTLPAELRVALHRHLATLIDGSGGQAAAVRSSAGHEDGSGHSAAGQHLTTLAVRGPEQLEDAVRACWASLWTPRALAYRHGTGIAGVPRMSVLVQRMVDPEVAGVMVTGPPTVVEGSWGLGEPVVSGRVTPDSWVIPDRAIERRILGSKQVRADRVGAQVLTSPVAAPERNRMCLSDTLVLRLVRLGQATQDLLGHPVDVEWAVSAGEVWLLQARPVTAAPGTPPARPPAAPRPLTAPQPLAASRPLGDEVAAGGVPADPQVLTGAPGSPGTATGTARVLLSLADAPRFGPGDVLVCRETDPAWTPLFQVAAAVVTETGGLLSHAAIVARELRVPAVLAVPAVTCTVRDGEVLHVDGDTGHVHRVTSA